RRGGRRNEVSVPSLVNGLWDAVFPHVNRGEARNQINSAPSGAIVATEVRQVGMGKAVFGTDWGGSISRSVHTLGVGPPPRSAPFPGPASGIAVAARPGSAPASAHRSEVLGAVVGAAPDPRQLGRLIDW